MNSVVFCIKIMIVWFRKLGLNVLRVDLIKKILFYRAREFFLWEKHICIKKLVNLNHVIENDFVRILFLIWSTYSIRIKNILFANKYEFLINLKSTISFLSHFFRIYI